MYPLERYFSKVQDSEMYLTAKRSIKTGLIASSVVSSWTLSATLLTSTTFGYSYGIAATFWFGGGCSVPIFTFAVPAIEFKRKAPNAHAFLELVKHRYGASGHVVLGIFPLTYQISIAFNLLVGGVDAFNLVDGNAGDEFPTMRNLYGGHVKLIFLDGGFSATVNSQLFQKATAADPKSTTLWQGNP
ncbi:hypothetical protein SCARD494_05763 [Seiridium cardinale]